MKKPLISLIHPTGNPNSREAALALAEAGLLHEIITAIAYNPQSHYNSYLQLLPPVLRKPILYELSRRTWLTPPRSSIKAHPVNELLRVALMRTGIHRRFGIRNQQLTDWIYQSLDDHVAQSHLNQLTAVYAYEDGAASTFSAAKQQEILCLYDLPIIFYQLSRKIQQEEAELFPELASALTATQEPAWKLERKQQEVQLADHIFVASSITQKSLLDFGVDPHKISVIPYGAPLEYFQVYPKIDQTFRALYVGRLEPRKGIHYLLEAWKKLNLKNAELWLVGVNEYPPGWLEQYSEYIRYFSSVPHASLNEFYSAADVLVFPSLVEGFGLVLLEAMACGIPIISTGNTAAPDLIKNGKEGFIIPIRDVQALQEKLEWCYSHREELAEMGKSARLQAETLTWKSYRQKLGGKVKSLITSESEVRTSL